MLFNSIPFLSRRSRRAEKNQGKVSARKRQPTIEPLEDRALFSGITPVILSSNVPSEIVAGSTLRGKSIHVELTDSLPTPEVGYTVKVFASTTPTLDTTVDPLVTSVIRPNTIKSLRSTLLSIPITSFPSSVAAGTYYLNVETLDLAGNTASIATDSTVTIAAPFIALAETVTTTFPPSLVSGSDIKGSAKVVITNNGNIPSKGSTAINITASLTPGVAGTSIESLSKNLNIPVGKTVSVNVPIKSLPVLPDGVYYGVAAVTDPNGGVSVGTATGVTVAAPVVSLTATLGSIAKVTSGDTVYVTNAGNVIDSTRLHATFGFSTDAAGLDPVGSTVTLSSPKVNIKPGKTISYHLKPSKAFLAGLTAGVPYYLTVTFQDDTGHMGAAVSPDTFTV